MEIYKMVWLGFVIVVFIVTILLMPAIFGVNADQTKD